MWLYGECVGNVDMLFHIVRNFVWVFFGGVCYLNEFEVVYCLVAEYRDWETDRKSVV